MASVCEKGLLRSCDLYQFADQEAAPIVRMVRACIKKDQLIAVLYGGVRLIRGTVNETLKRLEEGLFASVVKDQLL